MKQLILAVIVLFFISCNSQSEKIKKKFNLDFESYDSLMLLPKDWIEWGDYNLGVDTVHTYSGRYAPRIVSKEGGSFGCIAYHIPARYEGSTIRLEGYMKIEDVADGFAGLLLRIDGQDSNLVFDNMQGQNIQGTKDWQKYSVTLPFPNDAETIFVGGILVGKGKAWFDDFVLTIDGKNVQTLQEKEKPVLKAYLDKEFDLGSSIEFPVIDEQQTRNLELLGKIWGFLKYHHPQIAKGNYNWDYELFRILPKYVTSKNALERDQVLLDWINTLGKIDSCTECKETSPDVFLKPDKTWFDDFVMNTELKNKLEYIYQNRHQGEQFYIVKSDGAGNPEFLNENAYPEMQYPDAGFRLLALYKYWNMIHYFFPSKYLTDKDWNKTLTEYIPKFIMAKDELEYELALVQLIGDINDTHAAISTLFNKVNSQRGKWYPPFRVQFIENQLVVTDYYNPELKDVAKVEVGDIITSINHKSIKFIVDSLRPYYPASNEAAKMRDITNDILRFNNKEISIGYLSNNQEYLHSLPLYEIDKLNMRWYNWTDEKSYKMLDGNIGYVTLKTITEADIPIIKDTFKNTKGIIIDIRNYPSSFVPFSLGDYFVSSSTPFVKFSKFNIDNPGEFNFRMGTEIPKPTETYKGKLVVLVNEWTQSQAEYTAMAFRAGDNTTIVGSTTAGADGNVSNINLPGGLTTFISGIGIYYPDGEKTQRIGIIPDVEVKPTIEGIKNKKDELLEKAIEVINKNQ